ncbi:MAG: LEA type 2 family protein [Pseudomonadota bacterium]|nr:LEA type 2 family protein [Pseudomonadota bacterium]
MILALLLGCTDGDFSAFVPQVKFQRLDLTAIDFEHIDVDFVFDVENPNPIEIPLSRFTYALGLEGIEILAGDDPNGLQLKAEGTSELALPVGLYFANIFDAVEATRGLDYLGFGLAGSFGFDTDLGPVDIAVAEEGSFPALRTPKFDLGQLRIESADASDVEFGLDVDLDNDHGSALNFTNLDFEMSFAGARVGDGAMEEVAEVPGATSKTVTIPFGVDYVDAINALTAAASGEKLQVDLAANVDVDTPFGLLPLTVDERGNIDVAD